MLSELYFTKSSITSLYSCMFQIILSSWIFQQTKYAVLEEDLDISYLFKLRF